MPEFWRLVAKRPLPRIHLLSDIHLETGPYAIPSGLDFDILIAAGDIGPVEQAVAWLASLDKPVVYVLGNHEYWEQEYSDVLPLAKAAAAGTKVHVLERTSAVIHGVRFLGATLWTDFGSWHGDLVRTAIRQMRDYNKIKASRWFESKSNQVWFRHQCKQIGMPPEFIQETISDGRFHPAIAFQLHLRTVSWLKRSLSRPFAGPTVVVTHHAPSFDSLRKFGLKEFLLEPEHWGYRYDSLVRVACYASRLDNMLKQYSTTIDFWAHGHLHTGLDVLSQGVRIVCNPRGYAAKPFDEQSARAFALFGYPVSQEDIERSQALHLKQPYRGDAPGFDDSLVINLESGLERPISCAIEAPLAALREGMRDATDLVTHIRRTRDPRRKYLVRCLNGDMQEFNGTLDELMGRIRPALVKFWEVGLAEPPRPCGPIHELDDFPDCYSHAIDLMDQWCVLVQGLPRLAQTRLSEWVQVSRKMLAMLEKSGVMAWIERLPVRALRRPDALRYRVVVNIGEEFHDEWNLRLNNEFGGGIPRKNDIWLRDMADISQRRRAALLTLKELDKFAGE